MKRRNYLIAGVVVAAALAVAIPMSAVQADEYMGWEGWPEISSSIEAPDSISEMARAPGITLSDAADVVDEKGDAIGAYLINMDGSLVYMVSVISDGKYLDFIVDAGNGEILYESESISLEEIESMVESMEEWH